MAKRKGSGDSALGILIILGIIVWAVYAVVRVLINLNERFIEAASGPAGIIGLFFGLLLLVSLLIRWFIYRGFKQQTADLELAKTTLKQQEDAFNERVNHEVERVMYGERKRLVRREEQFNETRSKLSRALQRIVDSAYSFKVKTLLSGTTINNWQSKYDQLRKEMAGHLLLCYAGLKILLKIRQLKTDHACAKFEWRGEETVSHLLIDVLRCDIEKGCRLLHSQQQDNACGPMLKVCSLFSKR